MFSKIYTDHFINTKYLSTDEKEFLNQCKVYMGGFHYYGCAIDMEVPKTDILSHHNVSIILFRLIKKLLIENGESSDSLFLRFKGTNQGHYMNRLMHSIVSFNNEERMFSKLSLHSGHKHPLRLIFGEEFNNSELEVIEIGKNISVTIEPNCMPQINRVSIKASNIQTFNILSENVEDLEVFIYKSMVGRFSENYRMKNLSIITTLAPIKLQHLIENFDTKVRIKIIKENVQC